MFERIERERRQLIQSLSAEMGHAAAADVASDMAADVHRPLEGARSTRTQDSSSFGSLKVPAAERWEDTMSRLRNEARIMRA